MLHLFSRITVALYSWREEFGFEYYSGAEHGGMTVIVNQFFRTTVVELCEQRQIGLLMDAPAYFRDSVELPETLSFLYGETDRKFFVDSEDFRSQRK